MVDHQTKMTRKLSHNMTSPVDSVAVPNLLRGEEVGHHRGKIIAVKPYSDGDNMSEGDFL